MMGYSRAHNNAPCSGPAKTDVVDGHAFSVPQSFDPAVMFSDLDGSDAEFRRWLENELGHGVSVPAGFEHSTSGAAKYEGATAQSQVPAPFAWPRFAASKQQQQLSTPSAQMGIVQQSIAQQQTVAVPAARDVNSNLQLMQQPVSIPAALLQQQQQQQHQARLREYCQQQQQLELQQQQLQQQMDALHRCMQPFMQQQQNPLLQQDSSVLMPAAAAAGLPPAGQSWSIGSIHQQPQLQLQQPCVGFTMQPAAPIVAAGAAGSSYAEGLPPIMGTTAASLAAQPASICFGQPALPLQQLLQQQQQQQQQQQGLMQFGSSLWQQQQLGTAGSCSLVDGSLGCPSFQQQQQRQQQGRSSVTSATTDGSGGYLPLAGVHDVRTVKRNNSTVSSAAAPAAPAFAAAAPAAAGAGGVKKKGPSTRFRERQRATISSLEAEVCAKLGELKLLTSENEQLKLRAAVLEATVNGREYHLKVLTEHVKQSTSKSVAGSVGTSAGHSTHSTGALSSCSGGGSKDTYREVHDGADRAVVSSECEVDGGMRVGDEAWRNTPAEASAAAGQNLQDQQTAAEAAALAAIPAAAAAAAGAADCIAVGVKAEPDVENRPTGSPIVPAAAAAAGGACPAAAACCEAGCCMEQEQQPERGTAELRPFCCMRHISAESIIQHWKQFLQAVSQELLQLELEEAAQKQATSMPAAAVSAAVPAAATGSRKASAGAQAAAAAVAATEDHTLSDALAAVAAASKVCKWCGGGGSGSSKNSGSGVFGDAGMCGTAFAAAAPSIAAAAAASPAAATADAAVSDGCTPSGHRIIALVERYSYMTKYVAMLNPGMLYRLFGRNLDSGLPLAYDDEHWRQVVAHLGLRPQQVTAINECAELYFNSLGKLLEARKALQQQLQQQLQAGVVQLYGCEAAAAAGGAFAQQHLPVPEQQQQSGVSSGTAAAAAADAGNLHVLELLDLLSANLQREHVLRSMLKCFVWGRILDSIQFAKAAVYSHPLFPDVHAIVCILHGSKPASKQQRQHGMCKSVSWGGAAGAANLQQQQCKQQHQLQQQQQQQTAQQQLMPLLMQ